MMRLLVSMAASLLVSVPGFRACPSQCRCLDHDSIVNCHHADVDRLPSPLPPATIVIDADRNRISALYNHLPSSSSSFSFLPPPFSFSFFPLLTLSSSFLFLPVSSFYVLILFLLFFFLFILFFCYNCSKY